MNATTKFFIVMMAVNILITLVSFSYIIGGFIKQDVQQIGLSLLPFILYGLTALSMLLFSIDGRTFSSQADFASVMLVTHILLGLAAIVIIIKGFVINDISFLNFGFPILIVSGLTGTAIFVKSVD